MKLIRGKRNMEYEIRKETLVIRKGKRKEEKGNCYFNGSNPFSFSND